MAMRLCYWYGLRRVWRPVCFVHAEAPSPGPASPVIPGSNTDSSLFPYNGQSQSEMTETLSRIKQREAKDAVLHRLKSALTGLENATTEARVAIKSYDDFESSSLSTPADAVQSLSAEVGLSPSQTFSADSRAEGVSILLPLSTGSQEGGAGERTNAATPPSKAIPAKFKRPSRAVYP